MNENKDKLEKAKQAARSQIANAANNLEKVCHSFTSIDGSLEKHPLLKQLNQIVDALRNKGGLGNISVTFNERKDLRPRLENVNVPVNAPDQTWEKAMKVADKHKKDINITEGETLIVTKKQLLESIRKKGK